MAIPSRSDLSSAETLARNGGSPLSFAAEQLRSWIGDPRDTSQAIVTTSTSTGGIPTMSDTDVVDGDYPMINLCDGSMTSICQPAFSAGVKQIGFVFDFGSAQEFDFVFIKLGELAHYDLNIDVFAATDGSFSAGNYSQLAAKTLDAGSTKRLVCDVLGNGTDGFGRWSARYFCVRIERQDGGNFALLQSLSELIIARRRQFSFGPDLPFSLTGFESKWDQFESKAGYTYRRKLYSAKQTRSGTMVLADYQSAGLLDDRAQFDALIVDCDYGQQKIGYSTLGATEEETRTNCLIGYLGDGSIDAPFDGPSDRSWDLDFSESAPFVLEEV